MSVSLKTVCGRYWPVIFVTLVAVLLPLTALAQGDDTPRPAPVVLTGSQGEYPLGLHLELLEDPTGDLTIEDIASPEYNDQFVPNQEEVPNPGFTSDAIWGRFQARNEVSDATWRLAVADARLEYVDLYVPSEDGTSWAHQQAGRSRPFTVREVPYRYGVFKLLLPPGQTQTVYLRFQGATNYLLPLTIWSLEAFTQHAQIELLWFGMFYGAMLVMLGYNLFLFASLRDRSFLYLALFIVSATLNDAFREGLTQQYLWPAWRNLEGIEVTATLNGILLILFGITFLQTKIRTPWLHKVMVAIIPGFLIAYFYFLLGGGVGFHHVLALLTLLLLVAAGYLTWWQGYRPARYFLLAWLVLLGAATFHTLMGAGLVAGTAFSQQVIRIGMALMVLLLSLALADRIQLLQAETNRANRALRDSEYRLGQFLEAMPVGVAVFDTATRLDFVNQLARRLLNLGPDDQDGPALSLAQTVAHTSPTIAGSDQPYPLELMPVSRALQGEAASVDDMELRGLPEPVQLETRASPVYDEQGQLQYAITAFQDITRRKRLEGELERHRERLEERVAERTRQLSAFLDMTMLVSKARPLPEMIDVALNRILEFCQCQAVVLHRLEDEQTTLRLVTQRGLGEAQQEQLQTIPLAGGLAGWLSLRQGPLLAMASDNVARLPGKLWLAGFQVYMGVQLRIGERVLGLLSYYRFGEQGYSLDEISLLSALTEQLAIIIENHRLRSEIEDIAVVAERQRLARDMHDSINQSLYSINLFTHAAREAGEDEDPKRLADSLARIETIAQASIKEMRLLLYQLQPDVLAEKGLAEALRLRFDSVERRLGIEVDYEVKGRLKLPGEVAEGLYWTALEALNNSLKHARASQLTVRLTMHKPVIELEITDNGRGFEPERVNRGMGLANIRQRLEQLNGCLLLSSATGAGTKVEFAASVDSEPVKQREDVTG